MDGLGMAKSTQTRIVVKANHIHSLHLLNFEYNNYVMQE